MAIGPVCPRSKSAKDVRERSGVISVERDLGSPLANPATADGGGSHRERKKTNCARPYAGSREIENVLSSDGIASGTQIHYACHRAIEHDGIGGAVPGGLTMACYQTAIQ
jgi:hypothetical protein